MTTLLATTALIGTATASTTQTTELQHARHVVTFFQNHSWLRAPNHNRCTAVPWQNQCLIARRIYRQKHALIRRVEHQNWMEYQYDWQQWLPDKWQRIGACETGYGRRPGNWQHNSGTYQGAFGFANASWDEFSRKADPKAGPYPSEAYLATPRQQYEVALAIVDEYGLSGWGCRNA